MNKKILALIFIFICTLLNATAQVIYKIGAKTLEFDFIKIITNYYLASGLFIYALSFIFFVLAIKQGELTIIYPILATGYIWVSIASAYFFSEVMNTWKWCGIASIVVGVILLSRQEKKTVAPEAAP